MTQHWMLAWFFRGSEPVLLRNPIFCDSLVGQDPSPPSGSAHGFKGYSKLMRLLSDEMRGRKVPFLWNCVCKQQQFVKRFSRHRAANCFSLESLVEGPDGCGYGPEGNEWVAAHLRKPRVLSKSYTMGCPPVRGDNPRALASGLSNVQLGKHGITILCHLHQCRPCTSRDIPC